MRKLVPFLALALLVGLVACGGGGGTSAGGDAQAGEQIFNGGASPPCSSCHSLQPGQTLVGPSLAGIADLAGQLVPGESAEQYLHESIVDPNAYVVEGFQPGVMPSNYGTQLSEQQINDLVAYLMTLH
ncbi:MAG: c-type cytochrome [Anaerolineae bacterium]|jgi:cytochrome c2